MFAMKTKLSVACSFVATAVVTTFIGLGGCTKTGNNVGGGSGPCGAGCPTGSSCVADGDGYVCKCQPGLTACGSACVDTTSSAANCGGCDIVCGHEAPFCSAGACSESCTDGLTPCGNDCVPDTSSNPYHCGSCNNVCEAGLACVSGTCGCAAGASCGPGGDDGGDDGSDGGDDGGGGDGEYGGYITSGNWKGYAWTHAQGGATIDPDDFEGVTAFPLCASGVVADDYDSLAMVGWNINQGQEDEAGAVVTPTLEGIYFNVTNPGNSPLRIQLAGPEAETNPDQRWCAPIGTGGENFVPYEAFNTQCWDIEKGTKYNGEPFNSVAIMVPGDIAGPISYNFCIQDLAERNSDGSGGGGGCSLAGDPTAGGNGPMTWTEPLERTATSPLQRYAVQNNFWNNTGGSHAITFHGNTFEVTTQTATATDNGWPVSYPSILIGSSGGDGYGTQDSNLPRQISQIQSVPTGWAWDNAGVSGKYNAAYDVWFNPNGADSGKGQRKFLMVWFHASGGPVPAGGSATTRTVAGRSWQVYTGIQHEERPIISYVTTELKSWEFDLKEFIDDAVSVGVLSNSDYLTNIFAGFEIWSGGVGLKTTNFCASVN